MPQAGDLIALNSKTFWQFGNCQEVYEMAVTKRICHE